MKKFFIIIFFLVTFLLPKVVLGQDFTTNVPGLTCGVAGDVTGKDICCNLPKVITCDNPIVVKIASLSGTLVDMIPFVGLIADKVKTALDRCASAKDFVDKYSGDTQCLAGEAKIITRGAGKAGYISSCKCIDANVKDPNTAVIQLCTKYLTTPPRPNELKNCINCAGRDGLWTGMGCLPLDLNSLITSFVLTTGIGIGGGFALLCIIYAAFMMQSSQGNPEKLKKAQEMITSCIMGLMLIIFSVFIMRLIGVNILRIPGFGG